jgi:hypothetical protein
LVTLKDKELVALKQGKSKELVMLEGKELVTLEGKGKELVMLEGKELVTLEGKGNNKSFSCIVYSGDPLQRESVF